MYKKGFEGWRKHLDFIAIDILCMIIALWGAFLTRHGFKQAYIGHIPYYGDFDRYQLSCGVFCENI